MYPPPALAATVLGLGAVPFGKGATSNSSALFWPRMVFIAAANSVAFTPESFQPDPGQIPNLDPMAAQESARVLAYISPAAAAQLARPMPQLLPLTDLESMLQPYGMGAGAPA